MTITKKMIIVLCPLIFSAVACSHKGTQSESAMQKNSEDASKQVTDATPIIRTMAADPKLQPLMQNAHGIFVIPHYGQAALGLGAKGGQGILMVKQGSDWSDPAFYDVGGLSIGLQAGAEGGSLGFILNNDRAVQKFINQNNFQVSANAGLTVVNYSKATATDLSRADMVAWSDSRGLFGGASIGLQDVRFDKSDTSGFYGKQNVTVADIISGSAKAPEGKVSSLKEALATNSMSDRATQ